MESANKLVRHLYVDGHHRASMTFEVDEKTFPHIDPLRVIENVLLGMADLALEADSELDLFEEKILTH